MRMPEFDRCVVVQLSDVHRVSGMLEARRLLMRADWPRRGPWHDDACQTAREVLEGLRPVRDARLAFRDAAVESGILLAD